MKEELYELCSKYCGRLIQSGKNIRKTELLRRLKHWAPLIVDMSEAQEAEAIKRIEAFVANTEVAN